MLTYPYSFDGKTEGDDEQWAKKQAEEKYKLAAIQNQQLYSPIKEEFDGAKEFAQALHDICEIEGKLEKKRRELALRSDFNLCDVFKMFGGKGLRISAGNLP